MSTAKSKVEEKDENLVSMLMFRFVPYWPLFLLLLALSGLAGWLYLSFATRLYEATATILIKDEKKGVDDSKMLESLNIYNSKKIVENEMEIISSRSLMKDVVDTLHLYAPVYVKQNFREDLAYADAPISIVAKDPDTLSSSDPVLFTYNPDKASITFNQQTYALNTWQHTPYGVLKFIPRPDVTITPDQTFYFKLRNPKSVAAGLVYALSIAPASKVSTVLELTFQDQSPERAQDILNALVRAYTNKTLNEKSSLASNTLSFIEDRLRYVVADLDSIEHTIQRYKSQRGIVDLSEQGRLFLQNVGENDRQVGNITGQLAVLDQVEQYVLAKGDKSSIVPATLGLNDPVLSDLLQKLYDSELQYGKLKQTMAENSPSVTALANEIATIRPAILENVRNQKNSLEASRKNLYATNGLYTSMMKAIPQKERELVEISRQQSIKNSVYLFLLQKREETALSTTTTVADSRLIDAAEASYTPVSPKKSYIFLGSVIIAFIIGIGIVSAKEFFTGKILFRSDIEKYTKVPIVAEITSIKHKNDLVVNNLDNAFIAEQFRHLRAAIGLYGRVTSKKKILITSSIAGEGKSFVASNLALSLAISGKKVVLLDVDLRSPKTTATFSMEQAIGISEYLQGAATVREIIKDSGYNNLSVIPAGAAVRNPTELLLNGKLTELFAHLENLFDYVLVDTSPVDPVTDAYVLSEYCNKTLFVIRHGYTPKTMVQLLDENNKIKALHNLAIVFNGIKKRGFLKGNYGFGYGFGYEYVYKERKNVRAGNTKPSAN